MITKPNFQLFKNEIECRKIKFLIHFTECTNLLSIVQNNMLLSHDKLEELSIDYKDITEINDLMRIDGFTDYINLSIDHPNYYLLRKFRQKMNAAHINWCILKIDPKYIYHKDTLFSVGNAASNSSKSNYKITGDLEKFKMLFENTVYMGPNVWNRRNLKDNFTTDIQAEVLVKEFIPFEDILEVCFENSELLNRIKQAFIIENADFSKFKVDQGIFSESRF